MSYPLRCGRNKSFFNNIGIGKDMNSAFNGIHVPGSASAMKQDAGKVWMFSTAVIIIIIVTLSVSALLVFNNNIIPEIGCQRGENSYKADPD
jgi:cytochrome c-type biogenesis protein CcmH/NrfG